MPRCAVFLAVLVNQAGRVMVPAIKTSVLADPTMAGDELGLKWYNAGAARPKTGNEINNGGLASALGSKKVFTRQEFDKYQLKDLRPDSFIKTKVGYMKPSSEFQSKVGGLLSAVSLVCLGGKLLGAAFTDKLGGWMVLIAVFVIWIIATLGAVLTPSVDIFGGAWLLNSFAYTITWGAAVQVIGAVYGDKERPAELAKCASASRFGATLGNIFFGQLLSFGLGWRQVLLPMLVPQAVLLLFCFYKFTTDKASAAKPTAAAAKKAEPAESGMTMGQAALMPDFWLMLIPKAVLFTYTQFFMNYIPQLLKDDYGYDDGAAATLGGVAQGGSVFGLLVVGNMFYKSLPKGQKVWCVAALLAMCAVIPFALSLGPSVVGPFVVPLTVLWGLAYAMPFYIPPGEAAMAIGGKTSTALFTNVFDAAGFAMSAAWNPWASALAKVGDFQTILLSQALFGAISMVAMPLCMHRQNVKDDAKKKK